MIVDPARPARPALRYYGGKYSIAPWIISHFPPHTNYLEPCSGGASVILAKPRSKLETINDIDGDVFNFFRVLRDQPDELIRRIHLTPWARAEYEADGRALRKSRSNLGTGQRASKFTIIHKPLHTSIRRMCQRSGARRSDMPMNGQTPITSKPPKCYGLGKGSL